MNCSAFPLLFFGIDLVEHARMRIILDDHDVAKPALRRLLFLLEKAVESRHVWKACENYPAFRILVTGDSENTEGIRVFHKHGAAAARRGGTASLLVE